ncbi:hypothetical protein RGQ15_10340 [Paracoccus sp. MBLB3053]|uniref:Uncharacterized protein n=1 Tax=Paracoccus aurantius TaxID=3073814 RepID=A0ABU2HSF9_9RHOB|nr:hypothetical protein [Paracoccus sp. MBLB3053]MDS9467963.1 hypothetical protein [Paracoccus sp. MBLB3053]
MQSDINHELSHGIAACLSLVRHDHTGKHYGSMMVHLKPTVMGTQFSDEVPTFLRRKVNALSALGPVALLPKDQRRSMMKRQFFETSGLLSESDVSVLHDTVLTTDERNQVICATAEFFYRYDHQLKQVAARLRQEGEIRILAPLLVPRGMAKKANFRGGIDARAIQ